MFVGLSTTVAGGALALTPKRFGPKMGLTAPAAARVIGLADLALVPGSVLSPRQGPWLAARAVLNLAIIGHLVSLAASTKKARLPYASAAGLAAASLGDLKVVAVLRKPGSTDKGRRSA